MADEIRTGRLVLRRATMADTKAMHRLLMNPLAMRYWSSLPHERIDQTAAWIRSMVDATLEESDDYIVTLGGALIGKLGCWRLPEIGFLLDPAVWGRGFATEALSAFIVSRRSKGPGELTADVDPRNISSIRLLKRAGFVETGRAERTWQLGEEWCDSLYLRLSL